MAYLEEALKECVLIEVDLRKFKDRVIIWGNAVPEECKRWARVYTRSEFLSENEARNKYPEAFI